MADKAMTPKSNVKKILGLLVVLALIVAAALYYGGFLGGSEEDMPPSLDLTGETGQGMLVLDAYLQVSKDETSYDCDASSTIDIDVPTGSGTAVFVYPTEDVNFDDLTTYIQAKDEDAKVMFVYWNEAGDGTPYHVRYTGTNKNKNWYAYPGVTSLTKLPEADLDEYEIEAYHGFYIVAFDADVEVCPDKLALQDEGLNADADFYDDYIDGKLPAEGWVLLAANDEDVLKTILEESTAADSDFTVDSAWVQMDDDVASMFVGGKVDLVKFYNGEETLPTGYDMVWLKITDYDEDKVYLTDTLDVVSAFASVEEPNKVIVTFDEEVKTIDVDNFGIAFEPLPDVAALPAGVDSVEFVKDEDGDNVKTQVILNLDADLLVDEDYSFKVTATGLVSDDDQDPLSSTKNSAVFNLTDYLNRVGDPVVDEVAKTITLTFDQDLGASAETASNYVFNTVTVEDEVEDLGEVTAYAVDTAEYGVTGVVDDKNVVILTLDEDFVVPDGMTIRLTMNNLVTDPGGETFSDLEGEDYYEWIGGAAPEADYLDLLTATSVDGSSIVLTFDEDVNAAEAVVVTNYVVTDDAAAEYVVGLAVVATDNKKVTLKMNAVLVAGTYTVTVSNLLGLDGSTLDPVDTAKSVASFEVVEEVAEVDYLDLMTAKTVDGLTVGLGFDQDVFPADLATLTNFTVKEKGGETGVYTVKSAVVGASPKNIDITVEPVLAAVSGNYIVEVFGLHTVDGVGLDPAKSSFEFKFVAPVVAGDGLNALSAVFYALNSNRVLVVFDDAVKSSSIDKTLYEFKVVDSNGNPVLGAETFFVNSAKLSVTDLENKTVLVALSASTPALADGQYYELTIAGLENTDDEALVGDPLVFNVPFSDL